MKKIFLVVVILFNLNASDSIKFMTEVFPPFQIVYDAELAGGVSVEIIKALQKQVGDTTKIKVYPWTRAIKLAEKKKNHAVFSTLRTIEREDQFKWVGPLAKMELVFFKNVDSNIELKSIEDAKKVNKIGVTKKVANYDILISKGFTNLDVIKSGVDEKNIKKLVKGRIDLWPSLKSAGLYNAKTMGFSGKIKAIDNVVIFEGALYIAFNKQTDDQIIEKYQKALDKLKERGTLEKIKNRYR